MRTLGETLGSGSIRTKVQRSSLASHVFKQLGGYISGTNTILGSAQILQLDKTDSQGEKRNSHIMKNKSNMSPQRDPQRQSPSGTSTSLDKQRVTSGS